MKMIIIIFLFPVFSIAQDINLNSTDFKEINLNKVEQINIPIPQMNSNNLVKDGYDIEITNQIYLIPQAGKETLFTFVKTEEEFKEFQLFWIPVLDKYGLKLENVEYKKDTGFAAINYKSKDGLVIRDFWADQLNYDALNESEILKLKKELTLALKENGMEPVISIRVNNSIVRPTFKLYYLTKKENSSEKEIRLRHLKNGEDIDFEVLENAVKIVRKDSSFSLVYIGKELGFVSKLASDLEAVNKKIEEYKNFLTENKKELIGYKIKKLDQPLVSNDYKFNFLVNFYFFQ